MWGEGVLSAVFKWLVGWLLDLFRFLILLINLVMLYGQMDINFGSLVPLSLLI